MADTMQTTFIASTGDDERPTSRADAEAVLERAALALLQESGALAGLNPGEVADRAGINRGLFNHHYGSRQDLLRFALDRDLCPGLPRISKRVRCLSPNALADCSER
jgi:AcrR family transcriptional regulator